MVSSPSGLLTFFVSPSARNRTSPLMLARLAALLALTVLYVPAGWSAGPTIVVVGDSLSSGYGLATADQSWVAELKDRLDSEGYGYEAVSYTHLRAHET